MFDWIDDATWCLAEGVYLGVTAGYFTIWLCGALGRAAMVSATIARGRAMQAKGGKR